MGHKGRASTLIAATIATLALGAAPAHAEPAIALLGGNLIASFDTTSPGTVQAKPVLGLEPNQTLRGIDVRPSTGQLFGIAVFSGSANNSPLSTYTIDAATGQAMLVGATASGVAGAGDFPTGTDFNPAANITGLPIDRIRYVNTADENARLNPNNGARADAPTNDTDLTAGAEITAVAYDRNVSGSSATTLYAINRATNSLATVGGINGAPSSNGGVVIDIGPLTVAPTAGFDGGFDITPAGSAFAALTTGPAGATTGLYSVNTGTGAVTLIGTIGNGTNQVYSLAILPDADGDGVLVPADNCAAAANPDQADLDGDGAGDACDPDQDGDGLADATEVAIGADPRSTNSDGDGVGDGADACPTLPGTLPNGCPDIALPDTTITKGPKGKTTKRKATVEFTSTEEGSTFACSLDRKPFVPCASPQQYSKLKLGKHFVDVRAIDAAGNLDPTPATAAWRVKPKKKN